MSDFERYLNWISRMQFLSGAGLVAGFVVGIMSLCGVFGLMWGIIVGVASGVVLIASIAGLMNMNHRTFEVEESIHQRSYNTTIGILNNIHQKG